MNNAFYLQQGDVLLGKVTEVPADAKEVKTNVLQEGEHTGHAHRLHGGTFQYFETPSKERFLKVIERTCLKHEEHEAHFIDPGIYQIGIVNEFDHFSQMVRNVVD